MMIRAIRPGSESEILRSDELFDEPSDAAALREYLADPRNIFLLAYEGERPIGFLRGTELGQLKSRRKQMFLYEIGVAASHRRRGAGRALIESLRAYCVERGFEEIFVFTDPTNQPAVRLYESTGGRTETSADRMYVYQLPGT